MKAFSNPRSILAIALAFSLSAVGCGGSDDDDGPGETDAGEMDAGAVVSDAGGEEPGMGPGGNCLPNYEKGGDGHCHEIVPMVDIPAGAMTLVHDSNTTSEPRHATGDVVRFDAFRLGKTPVTVGQFGKCVEAGACTVAYLAWSDNPDVAVQARCNYGYPEDGRNAHPMNCVSHEGAAQFCQWIGGHLPTSLQWEYAATHDGTSHLDQPFPWGTADKAHCQLWNVGEKSDSKAVKYCDGKSVSDSVVGSTPVGTYSPEGDSALGLVDMMGNVLEMTDSKGDNGWGGSPHRFHKGGSYFDQRNNKDRYGDAGLVVSADIGGGDDGDAAPEIGFRCVK